MLFLPFLVPILVGHFSVAIFNRGKVVQAFYLLLQPYNVELACRDIGFQSVGGLDKTVVRSLVAECVYQQVAAWVDRIDGERDFCVLHDI